jgi:hypothetical protein
VCNSVPNYFHSPDYLAAGKQGVTAPLDSHQHLGGGGDGEGDGDGHDNGDGDGGDEYNDDMMVMAIVVKAATKPLHTRTNTQIDSHAYQWHEHYEPARIQY